MKHQLAVLAVATMALSGCDSVTSVFDGSSTAAPAFDDQIVDFLDLSFDQTTMGQTSVNQMPTLGSATYDGVAGFAEFPTTGNVADYQIMADLSLVADFDTGAMTGELTNFNQRDDQQLEGSLRLSNGRISGSGFTADAIGTVDYGTDPLVWDLEVQGDFRGSSGQSVSGTANGTLSDGSAVTTPMFGDFVATN